MSTERRDAGLDRAVEIAREYLGTVHDRPVGRPIEPDVLRARLGGPLGAAGQDSGEVVQALAAAVDPGIVASAGPRYFGFVIGGSLPAALAADWLVSAWDQNAVMYASSPAAAIVEEVTAGWLLDLLGLPADSGVGFTTGAGMANATGLAAARHALLARAGWDAERQGLYGAPEIDVVVGDEVHATLLGALQYLGLGRERVIRAAADDQGRMRPDSLAEVLEGRSNPTIVAAQSGNVNSGACDPLDAIAEISQRRGAWLHVDGAFGIWAAVAPELRHLVEGLERADSWAVDAHKWLNVPYDAGFIAVRDAAALRSAMSISAAYLIADPTRRDNYDFVFDFSRRARAIPTYAALRSLGRDGVRDLVERCCRLARRMAERLGAEPELSILNDVVLNQVLVRAGDDDAATDRMIAAVQADGTCWAGGTTWQARRAMRISVSNWSTTESDIDLSAEAIIRSARNVRTAAPAG